MIENAKNIVSDYKKLVYKIGAKEATGLDEVIKKYAGTHGFILYGGSAIDWYVRTKTGGKKYLYEPGTKLTDFDFYSESFIEHGNELGKKLHEAGFKFVRVSNGKTGLTRSIRIGTNFKSVCDVNYTRDYQKKMLTGPEYFIDKDSGIAVASPYYLILDQYLNTFMNLYRYEFRINAAFEKIALLESVMHPAQEEKPDAPKLSKNEKMSLDKLHELNVAANDIVLAGDLALHWYINGDLLKACEYEPIIFSNYWRKEIKYEFDHLLPKEEQSKTPVAKVGGDMSPIPFNLINIRGSIAYYPVGKYKIVTETGLLYAYYYCKLYEGTDRFDKQIEYLIAHNFHKEERIGTDLRICISPLIETVLTKAKQVKFQ